MQVCHRVLLMVIATLAPSAPTAESAPRLRDALAAAGNRDATVRVFDHGNHGLLEARTGYDREVQTLSRYVPGFQDGLVRWIVGHVGRGGHPRLHDR